MKRLPWIRESFCFIFKAEFCLTNLLNCCYNTNMKFFRNKKNNVKKWILLLAIVGFIAKLFSFKLNKKNRHKIEVNFKDFLDEEKEEVEELVNGKEGLKRFFHDSGSIFKQYFIPSEDNEHKPKILRTKSLAIIVVALIIIKMSVAGYLFCIYPNQARMSELITKQIMELINIDRKSEGVNELANNFALNESALEKAQDMVEKGYFAHESPDGRMPWNFINRSEYAYLFAGENLAMNFTSAQAAHNALMLSETHKKNILNQRYTDVGLAVLSGEIEGKRTNVLVQIFGSTSSTKLAIAPAVKEPAVPKQTATLPVNTIKQEITEVSTQVKAEQVKPTEVKPIEEKIENTEKPAVQDLNKSIIAEIKPDYSFNNKPASPDIDFSGMRDGLAVEVKSFGVEQDQKISIAANAIKISHYIFFIVLAMVAVSLLVNILVKFSIQHKPLILQSILVIIFIIGLAYAKTNFLEYVLEKVFVV